MNILDHRILIPKSSQIVWEHVSDLSKNPTWQVNCQSVSFLTSRTSGIGARWRYATTNDREHVAEITAWYEGLGYEYKLVDGVPFQENKGRIRLQEIPEGTIVQWTFSYDMGGLFGSVRNAVSFKRQFESVMVDSLKMLWRVLNQAHDTSEREVKSILRAGLDYEARAQYKPRHPSVVAEQSPTQPTVAPVIAEPPLSDEDTRPRKPIVIEETPDADVEEPAFLAGFQPAEVSAEVKTTSGVISTPEKDHQPTSSDDPVAVIEPALPETPEIQLADTDNTLSEPVQPPGFLPEQPVIIDIEADAVSSDEEKPRSETSAKAAEGTSTSDNQESTSEEVRAVVNQAKADTGQISVFDVFGLPKPSETQEIRAVSVVETKSTAVQAVEPIRAPSPRSGLRLRLRRKRVRVRRPE